LATNKTQAAKLLNAAEMAVYNASVAPAIKELTATRLAGKIQRARTLRDKFRDLLKRQKLATRSRTGTKVGTSGNANERTAMKAEVFDEVLQRFTTRLEQLQAVAAREATRLAAAQARAQALADKAAVTAAKRAGAQAGAKTSVRAAVKQAAARPVPAKTPVRAARSAKAPAVAPRTAGVGVGPGSERARSEAKTAQLAAARTRPIQGHISSAGRRTQAKRDTRR
jgi:hypothetical protein